ncbi:N-acetyltransferase [Marinomonas agarivorans]|nr:N-acetyltransferase [Marinomonas agarivorans]
MTTRQFQQAKWFNSIEQIGESQWQEAIGATDYPFAQYGFYKALEDSHSIGGETGWYPEYLVLYDIEHKPIAIAPVFLKTHSQAEFVFDWAWADAYHRHGVHYYPKRVWAIPFSPVTGPRLFSMLDPTGQAPAMNELYAITAKLLTERTEEQQLSSWHLLFNQAIRTTPLMEATQNEGALLARTSCQFHWFNRSYTDFEHYLSHFVSRKRKTVRKERQKIHAQGLTLTRKLGADLTEQELDFFYLCYQSTYAKRGQYGYLTKDFFQLLAQTMGDKILVVFAIDVNTQEYVGASWCFFDQNALYGRYWGCIREYDSLHFEACYYQGIEFCIEQGLQKFDPGTQGEHKIARGFEPVYSHSVHYISHPAFRAAIGEFCQQERRGVQEYQQQTSTMLPFKTT